MSQTNLFNPFEFDETEKEAFDRDGHFLLPGILTSETCKQLTRSLALIQPFRESKDPKLRHHSGHAAEYDSYLASLIAHPQMLDLIHRVLGPDIRFDHCGTLNRPPGHQGFGWHSHGYADDQPELGLILVFFYVNGFSTDDASLLGCIWQSSLSRSSHQRKNRSRITQRMVEWQETSGDRRTLGHRSIRSSQGDGHTNVDTYCPCRKRS